jgi:TET-Associated Glycosyltransferase
MNPKYPVYIVSKGRWESRLTSKALDRMGVPYSIVVEPHEHDHYAAVIPAEKILTLPFRELGQGSIPARNWIWEHAIGSGADRHWIVDDNINGFVRLHKSRKIPVSDGAIFAAAEDWVDRYTNIALAGFHYRFFVQTGAIVNNTYKSPLLLNSRVYSCILIKNDIPQRWRGRYNEDTDLSLRVLKRGWCTVLFLAFLANKQPTLTMKGGNTDELYVGDGRLKMAQSLQQQHPDVVTIAWKWNRWQHQVDYRPFKHNRPILRPGVVIPDEPNNYGMVLRKRGE